MNTEETRRQNIYKVVMLVIITAILTFLGTYVYLSNNPESYYKLTKTIGINSGSTFEELKAVIDSKYLVNEVDEERMLEAAKKGYIEALGDPYTEYMTKEEWESFKIDTMGNYTGIGIYMSANITLNAIEIISPIKDSPAYSAGLMPGDIILKVDDTVYSGEQMTEAANKIKGEEGTKVKLEIKRGEEVLEFEIERGYIKLNHVESDVLENNIGYLKVPTFDEGCSIEFKLKLAELKESNVKAIVLDLRNNPGGLVTEALSIAECFVDKNLTLLVTVDKHGNEEERKSKTGKQIDVPIVILTNAGSASASEILAGALKDHGVAKIVGEKTYGKGVIQEVIEFEGEGSALKVTTSEYLTPNRNKINHVGITPDVEVSLPEGITLLELTTKNDTQLKEAIELLKK